MLLNFRRFSKVYYALGIILLIVVVGTVGFSWFEHWTIAEAFYMTIITIATVGFEEVHPLSDGGRMFTVFLILTSFGTFAFAISAITTYVASGEYRVYFRDYKTSKKIEKLENHTVVCGYGRVGKQAAIELQAHAQTVVVIERDAAVADQLREETSALVVVGDATDEESLVKAGVDKAKALITAMPSDAINLFVVVSARALNPELTIISRAEYLSTVKKLKLAGADNVIMPDQLGGSHMASLVVTPDVLEFLDHISVSGEAETNLEEIQVSDLPANAGLKTVGDLTRKFHSGCLVLGYKTATGEYVVNPGTGTELVPNSKLFVLGTPTQIHELNAVLGL